MNASLISQILTVLSTMRGYPALLPIREDESPMDPVQTTYFGLLVRIPDDIGTKIRNGVLLRFDERPSVKNLADWAASLGPQKPFDIKQLDGPEPVKPAYRPGGMAKLAAPEGGVAAFAVQALPPPAAREIIARLKAKAADGPEGPADYGLQFEYLPGSLQAGDVSRTHPRMTLRYAEIAAADRNEKWPHQRTTVYHKGDPMPGATASIPEHDLDAEESFHAETLADIEPAELVGAA